MLQIVRSSDHLTYTLYLLHGKTINLVADTPENAYNLLNYFLIDEPKPLYTKLKTLKQIIESSEDLTQRLEP